VLAKAARLLANLATHAEVGATLWRAPGIDALVSVLQTATADATGKHVPRSVLAELLPNALSALTNVVFYCDMAAFDKLHAGAGSAVVPTKDASVLASADVITATLADVVTVCVSHTVAVAGRDGDGVAALQDTKHHAAASEEASGDADGSGGSGGDGDAEAGGGATLPAAEAQWALLLECLRALGNLTRSRRVRTALARQAGGDGAAGTSPAAPPAPVAEDCNDSARGLLASLAYVLLRDDGDVAYTAAGVLLNLVSEPEWRRLMRRSLPVPNVAAPVLPSGSAVPLVRVCALDAVVDALEGAYWNAGDAGRATILVQALCNYSLGWEAEFEAAAAAEPAGIRFTTEQCLRLLQFVGAVMEDADDAAAPRDGGCEEASAPLAAAAAHLQGLLRAMTDAGALADDDDDDDEGVFGVAARRSLSPLGVGESSDDQIGPDVVAAVARAAAAGRLPGASSHLVALE
jgi:hypothetical protein